MLLLIFFGLLLSAGGCGQVFRDKAPTPTPTPLPTPTPKPSGGFVIPLPSFGPPFDLGDFGSVLGRLQAAATIPPFPDLSSVSSTTLLHLQDVTSQPGKIDALTKALSDASSGTPMDGALGKQGLAQDLEAGRLALERAKQLSGELSQIGNEASTSNVSKENAAKVACFVLVFDANRGRLPYPDEYDRFGASEKLKQAPVIGGQVEHAKTFVTLATKLNNNTPDKVALRAAVSLVCSGVKVID
jgi:hypothetical protein